MVTEITIANSTRAKYKECIDFIYEATAKDGGYKGSFNKFGTREGLAASELTRRGILQRSGTASYPVYTWYSPAMSPTKTLYENITRVCVLKEREWAKKHYDKVHKVQAEAARVDNVEDERDANVGDVDVTIVPVGPDLSAFSDFELWKELKSRGWFIKDGALTKTTTME